MKALDVSSFFIKKGVTPLKLQKLLFYSQVWYFAKRGELLFPDDIEAWVLGPVVRNVWNEFRFMRRGDFINERHAKDVKISDDIYCHLSEIWSIYGGYTGLELVDLTHDEPLWIEARGGIPENKSSCTIMSINNDTAYYFRLDQQGNIPKVTKDVRGIAQFSSNAGEELF